MNRPLRPGGQPKIAPTSCPVQICRLLSIVISWRHGIASSGGASSHRVRLFEFPSQDRKNPPGSVSPGGDGKPALRLMPASPRTNRHKPVSNGPVPIPCGVHAVTSQVDLVLHQTTWPQPPVDER